MKRRRDILDVFEEMRRLFNETLIDSPTLWEPRKALPGGEYSLAPRTYTDMVETEKDIIFTAELPGVKKEDIEIDVTENRIDVTTEAKEESEGYSRYSGFKSSYDTPVPINPEKVKATYKNGVLEVRAPKKEDKKKNKIKVE